MKRGENIVTLQLPLEAMLPLVDYRGKHRIGSKSQAATQIVIRYLHEHELLSNNDLNAIKERTKIFLKDEDFTEEKMVHYKETVERKLEEKTTKEIYVPTKDLKYLKQIVTTIKTLPKSEWQPFAKGYKDKAEQYLPHPQAKEVLELLEHTGAHVSDGV